jgi:hypothetical protein
MSGMEPVLIGMAIAGGTANAAGQVSAAKSQAEAAQKDAAIKNMQADELLSRQQINEQIMREQADRLELGYGSLAADTGGAGTGIGGVLKIRQDVEQNISNSRRDAEFKAKMLRAGAAVETSLASDGVTASYLGAGGSILGGAASAYKLYSGPSRATDLPKTGPS